MGEYADMEIERDLSNYMDFGRSRKFTKRRVRVSSHENFFEEWQGEEIPDEICEEWDIFGFLEIKRETEKAWLLIMNGKAETWFPKKYCRVIKNKVLLPNWLMNKMAGWD